MTDAIAHRGPDGAGHQSFVADAGATTVLLGHRRLAIIDPVGGIQPMTRGPLTLIFNGEIYNFRDLRPALEEAGERFQTSSDTEVLLAAWTRWGPATLDRLRGMFAFALFDQRDDSLTLARDRFGKKPLFLAEHAGGLAFASEIKAILTLDDGARRLDTAALWHYLGHRYAPGPATLFQGVTKLPPGSVLTVRAGRRTVQRWWSPPDARVPAPRGGGDEADDVTRFLAALEDAVRARLVSDVPFGAFLSGGIDSAAVVGLMARNLDQPVRTFSIGFREGGQSELDHARLVAETFGCRHHEEAIGPDAIIDTIGDVIAARDAPVSEPSDVPLTLLARAAAREVKMVLTGEGSDELLAGYPKHRAEVMGVAYRRWVPAWAHRSLVRPLIDLLPYRYRRIKILAATVGLADDRARQPRWFGALDDEARWALVTLADPGTALDPIPFDDARAASPLRRILHFDQTSWLPDNLLERGDRVTMSASLEGRMPFLDHELAALVAGMPDDRRLRGTTTKWLLRQAMTRLLPESILTRPKIGFRVPVDEWFRGRLRDWLGDLLLGPDAACRDLWRRPALERLLAEHVAGRVNHEKLLWTLATLELFRRRYRV
jgi:asparagine synthase (glutamine-hydrolysing)